MVYSQSIDSTNIKISNSSDSAYNFQLIKRDSGLTTPGHGMLKLKNRITPDSATIQKLIKPQIKGRVGLEGYHTSFQNPRMLNEPQYLRLSGTSSVSLGGLPLLVDFYKTTEKQTFTTATILKSNLITKHLLATSLNFGKNNCIPQRQMPTCLNFSLEVMKN